MSRQGYNEGWELKGAGEEAIEPVAVIGTLNGYLLPQQAEDGEWTVHFAPQRWYRIGWVVTFAAVAGLAATGIFAGVRRVRRQKPSAMQATGK